MNLHSHMRAAAQVLSLLLMSNLPAASSAHAADPGFKNVTLASTPEADKSQSVFRPDTPKLFLRAELSDVPADAKMTCAWIASQAVGSPPNYIIATFDQTAGTVLGVRVNVLNCSLSKPSADWPVGSYRVELLVDGKTTHEARFEVRAEPAQAPVVQAPAPAAPNAPTAVPAVTASQARQNFTLVNRTGYDIQEVYVSPGKAKSWEEDVLGDDELEDGDEQLIRFNRAEKTCIWDLKVVYSEDDSEAVWHDIDLCKITKITIRYNRKADKTSATFE